MLELSNVSKSYSQKEVVSSISFKLDKPQIYGLLGANGAGKTTLIRMICGLIEPNSGEIKFSDNWELANIGYMPEEIGLYRDMNILDEIKYFGQLHGISEKESICRSTYLIKLFQLEPYLKKSISALSKGTARKVQFICTLLQPTKLLILDEPFSGLDPISSHEMENVLKELKSKGTTIILSTHRMEHAELFCDHIFIINHGRLIINDNLQHLRLQHSSNQYIIHSVVPINFEKKQIFEEKIDLGVYQYIINIDKIYTYEKMITQIGIHRLLSLQRKTPNLKEIFINSIESHETISHNNTSGT